MAKRHDKQFKLDAVQYYQDHKDLGVRGCAENLGIGYSTLTKWLKDFRNQVIFLFVVLVIMHLMSQKKVPASDVNYVMQRCTDVLKKQSTFWGRK